LDKVASANWPLPYLVKFAVIGTAGVVAFFIVAVRLLKVPGARRVL
jgi:hypothetical protein